MDREFLAEVAGFLFGIASAGDQFELALDYADEIHKYLECTKDEVDR